MKALALVLAAVFLIIAILYWTGHMPVIPVISPAGKHPKHAIVSVVLALLCLVWYRFQSSTNAR